MKILLYTDTPQTGGAELQIFLLAKFLDKKTFTPILVCSNYSQLDKWCENFEKEGIRVIRLQVKHKHNPQHLIQLRKIIKAENPDILHIHIWNPASCRYALTIKKIPIIVTEHDPFKLNIFKTLIKKHLLKKVHKIIAISRHNKKILAQLYPQQKAKIAVIHNGIDTVWWQSQLLRFTDEERKKIKEEAFQAKENTLIVITVAELHERKGQKYLLQAIPEIVKKFPNVKFIFIGGGPNRENLENLAKKLHIENHVEFLGKQKEIPKFLKSSDIFCLPSCREAFGLVNLEAMITGLPVIATRTGGIPEVIIDNKTGLLVESENSRELSRTLEKLIADPQLRNRLADAGQKRLLKNFTAIKMAQEYEKIYASIQSA